METFGKEGLSTQIPYPGVCVPHDTNTDTSTNRPIKKWHSFLWDQNRRFANLCAGALMPNESKIKITVTRT